MEALILTCGTGGGHNTAAKAVQEALLRQGDHATVLNPYTLCGGKMEKRIDRTYISLVQKWPGLFGFVYQLGNAYRNLPFPSPIYHLSRNMAAVLDEYLRAHPADVVVTTHLYPGEMLTQMKNQGMQVPKTVFVATDYTCIPFTEELSCDGYIIPTERHRAEFVKRGVPAEKIYPFGIPVRGGFSEDISKKDAKKTLGLLPDKRYILLCGGSMGAGKIDKTVGMLLEKKPTDAELIVICGSNEMLYSRLFRKYGTAVNLLKTTDKMAYYLRACDLYLSKPGGLSSTEAAVAGVPLVHLPPIPGCETINARFFSENGMSCRFTASPKNVQKLLTLLDSRQTQTEMAENQKKIIRKDGAQQIAAYLQRLCGTETEPQGGNA